MQRIFNYGSYLQAYGLKRIVEQMGHDVVFVDYKVEPAIEDQGSIKGKKGYIVSRNIWRQIKKKKNRMIRVIKGEKGGISDFTWDFEKNYLKTLGVSKRRKYRSDVDVLIIGSDEVFNCTQGDKVGFSKELFGADNHAGKVISYAASFGNTTVEKLDKYCIRETVAKLLENFSSVSVRDRNSYTIVKELTGSAPEIHLDPVLAYDFTNDIEDCVTEKNYIIVYAYNKRITKEEGKVIRQFAYKKGKKLIALSGEQDFCDEYVYCEPLKMLSYFKHADYIITDTFHGTIFSVITHKPFVTLVRKDSDAKGYGNQEKLSYLLEKLRLMDRHIEDISQLSQVMDRSMDYEIVDDIIRAERRKTGKYLQEQFE